MLTRGRKKNTNSYRTQKTDNNLDKNQKPSERFLGMWFSRAKGGAIFCSTETWLRCERSRKLSRHRQRGLKCRRQSGEGRGNSQGSVKLSHSLYPFLLLPTSFSLLRQSTNIWYFFTKRFYNFARRRLNSVKSMNYPLHSWQTAVLPRAGSCAPMCYCTWPWSLVPRVYFGRSLNFCRT